MKWILLFYCVYASFMWFTNRMATKGLIYHIGKNYGAEAIDRLNMSEIIEMGIDKTFGGR